MEYVNRESRIYIIKLLKIHTKKILKDPIWIVYE